jgi:hypothetical protein
VLKDFTDERRQQIEAYFEQAGHDQSLLLQLAPETLDLFNALVQQPVGVRCGSVVMRARPPELSAQLEAGIHPGAQAAYNLFRALHRAASAEATRFPALSEAQRDALRMAFGKLPHGSDNDAMVPTLSQVWGDVVHAAPGDHLDVIGHFADAHDSRHVDWLHTHSGFGRSAFEQLWDDVARYLFDHVPAA